VGVVGSAAGGAVVGADDCAGGDSLVVDGGRIDVASVLSVSTPPASWIWCHAPYATAIASRTPM
jgi:hypothetical protein